MKNVAITGGAGFLGSSLAAQLRKTPEFFPVILDTKIRLARSRGWLEGIETRELNFPSKSALAYSLAKADVLLHLASTSRPGSHIGGIEKEVQENVIGSIRLFEAAKKAGVKRIVFASSGGTVYGQPLFEPVAEDHITQPICTYGACKVAVERFLEVMTGLSPVILRIGNPYGRYQLQGTPVGAIANFVRLHHVEHPIEVWGDGRVVRDYIHIEDVVSAFQHAFDLQTPAGIYNVASGIGRSLNDILRVLGEVSGREPEVCFKPSRPFDVERIVLDVSKFRRTCGWDSRVSLKQGITGLWNYLETHSMQQSASQQA